MARKEKPTRTKYANIYEVTNRYGGKDYLATWNQNGRQYSTKNLTKLFGATTAKQALDKLKEIKVLISKGEDPFAKNNDYEKSRPIKDIVLEEIRSRNASEDYKYIQEKIFLKHLSPLIGKKKLTDLSIKVMTDVFSQLQKTESDSTIDNLKKTIKPTLDYAVDEGIIDRNPLEAKRVKKITKTSRKPQKAPLKHRLLGNDNERFLSTARALYRGALNFEIKHNQNYPTKTPDKELQLVFLLAIMIGRRKSEILSIKYEDITDYNTVKVRKDTTKSDVWEEYPLPEEVIRLLNPEGKGLIAPKVSSSTYTKYMRKLINSVELSVHSDTKITGHDSRHLFLTIMSKVTKNPFLCDSAISHSEKNYEILRTYYAPDISDYLALFNLYWALLRGEKEPDQLIKEYNSHF